MIPNFFSKKPIPDQLPFEMQTIVEELKLSANKEECLKQAYKIMTSRYRGFRFRTYIKIYEAFETDLEKLWCKTGFLHCHVINYLLRVLLVKSGWFDDDDIQLKYSLIWYVSPHQYLQVKVGENKFINVDTWNHHYGKRFGDYARGFH
jgi:hypothetical protein